MIVFIIIYLLQY